MKKVFVFFTVVAATVALASCGPKKTAPEAEEVPDTVVVEIVDTIAVDSIVAE